MTQRPPDEPDDTAAAEHRGAEDNPAVVVAQGPSSATDDAFAALFGEEIAPWPERAARRGLRVTWLAVTLVSLLLVVGGMGLGAYLQRTRPTSATSFLNALANSAGSRSRLGSSGSFPTTSGAATAGTVTDVKGHDLYVTTASGSLVKVVVGPSTTIDRNASSSLSSLKLGDTVTVEGTTAANGDVDATSVSASAKGVTTGTGASGVPGGFSGSGATTEGSTPGG